MSEPSGPVVIQRTIWAEAAPDEFGEERLQMDLIAQVVSMGKVPPQDEEVEQTTDAIWNDLSQVANLGKQR